MGESTGREDEVQRSEGSALPEGVAEPEGSTADPAYGDELQTFPPIRQSAGTLDLACANDEPTQLIRYLIVAAQENTTHSEHVDEWKVLLGYFQRANMEIERMQEPSHKRVKHGTL